MKLTNIEFATALRELADLFASDKSMTGLIPSHGIRMTSFGSVAEFAAGLEVVKRYYSLKAKHDQNCFVDVAVSGASIPLGFHLYDTTAAFPSRYGVPAEISVACEG